MVARYGQRNICPRIGNLQITLLYLMKKSLGEAHLALERRRWKAWTVISKMPEHVEQLLFTCLAKFQQDLHVM